jgi:FkbM family methyltransferase
LPQSAAAIHSLAVAENIKLCRFALGASDAELIPPSNIGAGSIVNYDGVADTEVVKCQVWRLADIMAAENLSDIRLIKIDVEGLRE